MFAHVLVGVDGSPFSDAALQRALAFARDPEREIVCVHAVDTRSVLAAVGNDSLYPLDPTPLIANLKVAGEAILERALATADAARVRISTRLILDSPVAALTRTASECASDLIVMGAQGRTGLAHFFLGSTTEGVLQHCATPVMTVRAATSEQRGVDTLSRILVAVDDSDPADAAIELALSLGDNESARLIFCTVIATSDLLDKAATFGYDARPMLRSLHAAGRDLLSPPLDRARRLGIHADTMVVEGDAAAEIVKAAISMNADLIVMGSHGRRGLQHLFIGSVAERIVRTSFVPVIVVRDTKPAKTKRTHALGTVTTQ